MTAAQRLAELGTDAPTQRTAEKALRLPVRVEGRRVAVGSGTEPGKVYVVVPGIDGDINTWWCDCIGRAGCSHAWAAMARLDPAVRRMLRQAAKG